jgi:hypothetical protein
MRPYVPAVAFLVISACGGTATEPSARTPRISGTVVDFTTGAGVPGISVQFGDAATMSDGSGKYAVTLPAIGMYQPFVDGAPAGSSFVVSNNYRGDFLVRTGTCVARYGTITDRAWHRPLRGATVSLAQTTAITGTDGWYRIDLGCPASGLIGFNTTFISVTHPDYVDASQGVGRGISGVRRLDIRMQPR